MNIIVDAHNREPNTLLYQKKKEKNKNKTFSLYAFTLIKVFWFLELYDCSFLAFCSNFNKFSQKKAREVHAHNPTLAFSKRKTFFVPESISLLNTENM